MVAFQMEREAKGRLTPLDEVLARLTQERPARSAAAQRARVAMLADYTGLPMRKMSDAAKRALQRLHVRMQKSG